MGSRYLDQEKHKARSINAKGVEKTMDENFEQAGGLPEGATAAIPGVGAQIAAPRQADAFQPEPRSAKRSAGDDRGRYKRNQKVLLGLGVAILVLVIIASSFALGFALGCQNDGAKTAGGVRNQQKLLGGGTGAGDQGPRPAGSARA